MSCVRGVFGLVRKIEDALARGQFILHYQPKVDCLNGRVVGLEALIRWQHPVLGLRMPGEFLPLIEHEDVIIGIGNWVIAEAPKLSEGKTASQKATLKATEKKADA